MITPKLPGPAELAPYLPKLEAAPGSIVLVAIEVPEVCNFARATCVWLSREERKTLKAALERFRRNRKKANNTFMQDTTPPPIDPSTGEPIPNPKPDPNLPDDWPPKPRGVWGDRKSSKDPSFRAGVPHLKIGL
jgi:hypothetical protein